MKWVVNLHHFFVFLCHKYYFLFHLFTLSSFWAGFDLIVLIVEFPKAIFSKFQQYLKSNLCIFNNSAGNSNCCSHSNHQHFYHWIRNNIAHPYCFFAINSLIRFLETKRHYWKIHKSFFCLSHLFRNSFKCHISIRNDLNYWIPAL